MRRAYVIHRGEQQALRPAAHAGLVVKGSQFQRPPFRNTDNMPPPPQQVDFHEMAIPLQQFALLLLIRFSSWPRDLVPGANSLDHGHQFHVLVKIKYLNATLMNFQIIYLQYDADISLWIQSNVPLVLIDGFFNPNVGLAPLGTFDEHALFYGGYIPGVEPRLDLIGDDGDQPGVETFPKDRML